MANSLFREGTALIDQILLETLTPIGREGWPTSAGDFCSMFSGLPISRSRLPGPSRTATKCRKERRASWGGRVSKKKLTEAVCGRLKCGAEERTMRRVLFLLLLGVLPVQSGQEPARPANAGVSGRWVVNTDFYGSTIYFRMELKQEGEKLSGNFDGDKLEGTIKGNSIYLLAKDEQGGTDEGKGTLEGATNKPVLTMAPGDSVHTTTVDAGGTDEKGVARVLGGNPETGPFYVETAAPGDTLVVHLTRLRLNRDWAESDDFVVGGALASGRGPRRGEAGKACGALDEILGAAAADARLRGGRAQRGASASGDGRLRALRRQHGLQ